MADYQNDSTRRLFQTIADLETAEECRAFFEDICTIKEILDMTQRLDTAVLLKQGVSYQKISQQVGVSTATIGRVSRALTYGAGGYQAAIRKMEEKKP